MRILSLILLPLFLLLMSCVSPGFHASLNNGETQQQQAAIGLQTQSDTSWKAVAMYVTMAAAAIVIFLGVLVTMSRIIMVVLKDTVSSVVLTSHLRNIARIK